MNLVQAWDACHLFEHVFFIFVCFCWGVFGGDKPRVIIGAPCGVSPNSIQHIAAPSEVLLSDLARCYCTRCLIIALFQNVPAAAINYPPATSWEYPQISRTDFVRPNHQLGYATSSAVKLRREKMVWMQWSQIRLRHEPMSIRLFDAVLWLATVDIELLLEIFKVPTQGGNAHERPLHFDLTNPRFPRLIGQ